MFYVLKMYRVKKTTFLEHYVLFVFFTKMPKAFFLELVKTRPEAGQYFHVPWQSLPAVFCKIGLLLTHTNKDEKATAKLLENMTFG